MFMIIPTYHFLTIPHMRAVHIHMHIMHPLFLHSIIAERINVRHWIVDSGPGIGS